MFTFGLSVLGLNSRASGISVPDKASRTGPAIGWKNKSINNKTSFYSRKLSSLCSMKRWKPSGGLSPAQEVPASLEDAGEQQRNPQTATPRRFCHP